jgi:hypothetical protein
VLIHEVYARLRVASPCLLRYRWVHGALRRLFADAVCAAGGFDRDHIGSAGDAAEAHRSGKRWLGYKSIPMKPLTRPARPGMTTLTI